MRRLLLSASAVLIVLGWGARPALAQATTASPSNVLPADQPANPTSDPDQPTDVKPDPAGQQPSAKPDAKKPEARPDPQTPGVRPSAVKVNDQVTIGGYGSVRYETNSLDEPKASGFDFRRFVLATDISPNDRLKAYAEIEFERFANIEVEKSVTRSTNGAAFAEDL